MAVYATVSPTRSLVTAALARGRFERIDDRGQPSLLPDQGERFSLRKPERWAAERDGFSVHAGVAFGALDRRGRELLCRYMLRPAIATERVSLLRDLGPALSPFNAHAFINGLETLQKYPIKFVRAG